MKCCYLLAIYVAILQHIIMPVTNAFIYVVVDLCNATNDNAYKSVGVDLSNAYMDIRQHIDALLNGGSCCSERPLLLEPCVDYNKLTKPCIRVNLFF